MRIDIENRNTVGVDVSDTGFVVRNQNGTESEFGSAIASHAAKEGTFRSLLPSHRTKANGITKLQYILALSTK